MELFWMGIERSFVNRLTSYSAPPCGARLVLNLMI
jgi:hypothetical protein